MLRKAEAWANTVFNNVMLSGVPAEPKLQAINKAQGEVQIAKISLSQPSPELLNPDVNSTRKHTSKHTCPLVFLDVGVKERDRL